METNAGWVGALSHERRQSEKNWWVALLLSAFFGCIGADRFYLGRGDLGVLKLITIGGFVIWWAFDFILLLCGRMEDGAGRKVSPCGNVQRNSACLGSA